MAFWNPRRNKSLIIFDDMPKDLTTEEPVVTVTMADDRKMEHVGFLDESEDSDWDRETEEPVVTELLADDRKMEHVGFLDESEDSDWDRETEEPVVTELLADDSKMAQVEYLEEPWQELDDINWDRESLENLRQEVEEYAPLKDQGFCEDKIPYVNILMLGPVGAGKSSFFNTVNSFFKNRLAIRARAGSSNTSLTKTFDVYKVKDSLRFRLCDCRGLEEAQGLDIRDIEAILDGHVMDGYVFNANTYITKENPKYNRNPTIADRIHCVVFVVDGSSHPDMIMSEKVLEQNRRLQEIMNTKRIPQLILLTKMDVLNSAFKKELPKVFYSQNVCEIVKKVAGTLGLPPYSVLPMLNLANSQKVSHDISVLTLYNLRQMLRACDDFLDNFVDELMSDKIDTNLIELMNIKS